MQTPLVSIIIPCFNGEAFVAEAINSALAQTHRNIEVVVIDDGSTDASLEVIRGFGERIRWESGPNRGACAARNRGIELAKGEFVQFLDADDLLHPEKIARQLPLAQAAEDLLVFCDLEFINIGHANSRLRRLDASDDSLAFILRAPLPTPAPLHRRSWLQAVGGFDAALPCSQERDLHLRLAVHGLRFRRLPEILCTVRRRSDSLSSDSARVLDQHEAIFLRAWRMLAERGSNPDAARLFAAAFVKDARDYVRLGRLKPARRYAQIARSLDRGGGISAFGSWYSRALAHTLGPVAAEQVLRQVPSLRTRRQHRSGAI